MELAAQRRRWEAERRVGERDLTPAGGTHAQPAEWRRASQDGGVALQRPNWQDARWSYLYGKDTQYAVRDGVDRDAVAEASRQMREGAPPDAVHGPVIKPP